MSRLMLEDVRLSYPKLWEPERFDESDPGTKRAWSASGLLDPKNPKHAAKIAEIEADMKEAFRAKCGQNFDAKWDNLEWDEKPLRDGKKKPENDGYQGMMFFAARATEGVHAAPLVLTRNRIKVLMAGQEGAPYGGCFVNMQVEIWAQYGKYKRVNGTLLGVQFVRDGDAFGGGAPADPDAFQDLGDQGEDMNDLA